MKTWTNGDDFVWGHTSGSTGEPKNIRLNKEAMKASARLTNRHFGLKEGDSILLCLSTDYIAGKMVVVRAIVGNLRLVVADTKSLPEWDGDIDFAAFVPMQIETLLHHDAQSRERLSKVETMIIGGSPLSQELQKELIDLGAKQAYITYGMTETLSHVAVAHITGSDEDLTYHALPGIEFKTDHRDCLTITAKHICSEDFVTNDVVELIDPQSFIWKGRFDNVVNSGGVKLFPEKIEKKISDIMGSHRFYLKGEPDAKLGTKLVMKIERNEISAKEADDLKEKMKERLSRYEVPREIICVERFTETTSGKVKRI